VESDPAALGVDIAEGSAGFFGSALAVDPAGRILPIRVTLWQALHNLTGDCGAPAA